MDARVFKALLRVRLASLWTMFGKQNDRGKAKKILYGLLLIYVVGILALYFGMVFYTICVPYCSAGLSWFYFGFVSIFALVLCFVGSIFTTQAQIYKAKDNDLLFSMPIKPSFVLMSRMITVGALNHFYALLVFIPAGVVYCMNFTPTVLGVVIYIILSLLLPFLSLALSCIAAWIIEVVSSRTRHKNVITIVLSLVFMTLYLLFVFRLNSYLTELVTSGASIAAAVKKAFFPAYYYGLAITEHNLLAIVISIAVSILPFALVYWVLSKNLHGLVTTNIGEKKKKYVERKLKARSAKAALLQKELIRFGTNVGYIMNTAIGGLFGIILCVMFVVQRDTVLALFGIIGDASSLMAVLMAAGITFCISMNFVSAPSISLEAKTLWLLKSLPVKVKDILMSKVYLHIIITAPVTLICSAISFVFLMPDLAATGVLFLLPQTAVIFGGLFGVVLNLIFPKLDWTNEIQAIKQGLSSFIAMFGGMAVMLLLIFVYVKLLIETVSLVAFAYIASLVFLLLSAGLYLYIVKCGERKFNSL